MVSGRGGRLSMIPLLINVGSGVGLLAIVSDLTEIIAKLLSWLKLF
jgi:hypothetical protein